MAVMVVAVVGGHFDPEIKIWNSCLSSPPAETALPHPPNTDSTLLSAKTNRLGQIGPGPSKILRSRTLGLGPKWSQIVSQSGPSESVEPCVVSQDPAKLRTRIFNQGLLTGCGPGSKMIT